MTVANNTNLRIDLVSIIGLIIFLMLFALLIFAAIYVLRRIFQFANKKLDATGEIEKRRPRGITIIAAFNFLGGLSIFYIFKQSIAVPVMGIVLKNHLGDVYYLITGILGICLGIGFLRLQKISWYVWMVEYAFFVLSSIFNILFFSEIGAVSVRSIGTTNHPTSLIMFRSENIFIVIYCIVLLLYMYSQRRRFGV